MQDIRNNIDTSSCLISFTRISGVPPGFSALIRAVVVKRYLLKHNIHYKEAFGRNLAGESVVIVILVVCLQALLNMNK